MIDINNFIDKLICGDCLEIMPQIPNKSVNMILCDLPYGVTECKWDEVIPFNLLWKEYNRLIKDRGAIVLTASQPFTTKLIMSNPSMFKYCWYWQKERGTNFQTAKYMPMKVIEECVVFGKGGINYYPIMTEITPYKHCMPAKKENSSRHMHSSGLDDSGNRIIKEYSARHPENILKISRDNMSHNKAFHPTQKPVALFEYLIKTYSNINDIVLDNCIGSGTTAIACINTNRHFIGIEKEQKYIDIANQRINTLPSKLDKWLNIEEN